MKNSSLSYKLVISFSAVLVLLTFLVSGCAKPSVATGTITNVTMSKSIAPDSRPVDPTTVFSENATAFYCSFIVSGFPAGSHLEVQWIYEGGDPYSENITGKNFVAETQTAVIVKEGRGYTNTAYPKPLLPDYKWPKGDYKVVINVEGMEKASTSFKVE
jgi:hypothetical protein